MDDAERQKLKARARELEARLGGAGVSVEDLRPLVEEYVQAKVAEAMAEFSERIERLDAFHGQWPGGATWLRMYMPDGKPQYVYPSAIDKKGVVTISVAPQEGK